jgi:hypothetical protein
MATLVVMAVFAAWQGYGRNLTADSGSAQATGTSSTVASPSASGSFASAFKAPVSYATALRYARQESSALCGYGTSRDYVLKRDMTNVVMNRYCKVQSGDLQDPYTGESMHFVKGEKTSTLVQIDHIVAVQDAWASGLWRSSRAGERVAYYNDPDVLQAADSTSNEAKGAGMDWDAPSSPVWLPDNTAWHCDSWPRDRISSTNTP